MPVTRNTIFPKTLFLAKQAVSANKQTGITTKTAMTGLAAPFKARSLGISARVVIPTRKVTNAGLISISICHAANVTDGAELVIFSYQMAANVFDTFEFTYPFDLATFIPGTDYNLVAVLQAASATAETNPSPTGAAVLEIFERRT